MGSDDRQLAIVVDVVDRVLGDLVVAVYRYGSAVHGGLRPASDLDVFVVTTGPLSDEHRLSLISGLLPVSRPNGTRFAGRPVEVTVAQLASLVPWPESPVREFQFGEWLRSDFDGGFRSPQTVDHDLAPLVATVLGGSVPIMGSSAEDLLVPVPTAKLVAAMKAESPQLLDELDSDTTNVLLTLCRMLLTAATGEVAPKDVAADWVLDELRPPAAGQLAVARDRYRWGADKAGPFDLSEVSVLASDLAARIHRLP